MLVEFKVGNYRSFREEQALSLVASTDTELSGNCVDKGKLTLLKAVGIYGPNASGKSNLIRALSTMQQIIEEPAKPGEKLPITPFKLDDEYNKKPSFFEVTFYHGKLRYQYGFTATSKRIYDEWLYAYPKGRSKDIAQSWFERKFNRKLGKTDWSFGSYLKGEKQKLKDRTTDNVLLLSVGAQWNNKQLAHVYTWFKDNLRIVPSKENFRPVTAKMLLAEKEKGLGRILYDFVEESIRDADMGIRRLDVIKSRVDKDKMKFPDEIPREVREMILENLSKPKVEMAHRNVKTGKDVFLPLEEESDGTQRFFQLLGPWLETVVLGYTVFIDEMEAHLHPLLTRELIKFIQNLKVNKKGAQLVFATHDTTLLSPELFRRDQIWFTEKDEHSSTRLYPLSDYKPRKGEAMQKGYLSGRYGAIPIIEAFKLNG